MPLNGSSLRAMYDGVCGEAIILHTSVVERLASRGSPYEMDFLRAYLIHLGRYDSTRGSECKLR